MRISPALVAALVWILGIFNSAGSTITAPDPKTDLASRLSAFALEFDRDVVLMAWLQDARRAGLRLAMYRNAVPPPIAPEDWNALDELISRYRTVYPRVNGSPDLNDEISEMTSAALALGDRTKAALAGWRAWFTLHGAKRAPAWDDPDLSGAPPIENSFLVRPNGKCERPLFGGDYRTSGSGRAGFTRTRLLQYDYQMQVYDGVTWDKRDTLSLGDDKVFGLETALNIPLALILSYSNHGFVFSPSWLWPVLRTESSAFVAPWAIPGELTVGKRFDFLNVHHPLVRDALRTYLDAIARRYRSDRRIVYYQGPWEATDGLRGAEGGRDSLSLAAFREALKARYGDVTRLNETWHSDYRSFEGISLLEERSIPAPGPQMALSFEFQTWRRDRFMGWWAEAYRLLKSTDPTHPVGADGSVPLFNADVASAVDYWRLPDAGDIISIHSGDSSEITERYLYSLRRCRPEKTTASLEFIWNAPECWKDPPERVAFAAGERNLWRSAGMGIRIWNIYGQNDTYVPRASPTQSAFNNLADFTTEYSILRPCAGVIPLLRAKIRGLREVFDSSELEQPLIGLLQPSSATASPLWAPEIASAARAVDAVVSPGNRPYAVIFEEAIASGQESLKALRVLILPYAIAIPKEVAARIFSWMKDGGHVWAIGPAGRSTVYGYADGWLSGAVRSASRAHEAKDGTACDFVGRGVFCAIDSPEVLQIDPVRGRFLAELDRIAPRVARADSADLGLITRIRNDGTRFVVAFNRNTNRTTTARIDTSVPVASVTDLGIPTAASVPTTRNAVGGVTFEFALEPGAGTVFEMIAIRQRSNHGAPAIGPRAGYE